MSSFSSLVGAMAFMNQDSRNLYAIVGYSVWLVSYLITSTSRYSNQLLRFVFQRPTVQLLSAKPYRQEPEIYLPIVAQDQQALKSLLMASRPTVNVRSSSGSMTISTSSTMGFLIVYFTFS